MSFKKAICAICDKPQAEAYKPFCSAKCKLIDLETGLMETTDYLAKKFHPTRKFWIYRFIYYKTKKNLKSDFLVYQAAKDGDGF